MYEEYYTTEERYFLFFLGTMYISIYIYTYVSIYIYIHMYIDIFTYYICLCIDKIHFHVDTIRHIDTFPLFRHASWTQQRGGQDVGEVVERHNVMQSASVA